MKAKMENVCPVDQQMHSSIFLYSSIITFLEILKQVAKVKPDKHIIGRMTISTKLCDIFDKCSLKAYRSGTRNITYIFHTDKSLRTNVTFVHFHLISGEKFELIN